MYLPHEYVEKPIFLAKLYKKITRTLVQGGTLLSWSWLPSVNDHV